MSSDSWFVRRLHRDAPGRVTVARSRAAASRLAATRDRSPAGGPSRRHLVVCGDNPLAHRLVEELLTRYRVEVTVILPTKRRNHGPQIARLPVRIVESDRLDADAFRAARLGSAAALALVQQDDVGNIHAALQAQEINSSLRLVIRMFNMSLGNGIKQLFADCAVLSDAAMAAPSFVAAALGRVAPMHVRLPGRTLFVARRTDVRPQDVMCGLAASLPGHQPDLLPAEQDQADLVLAVASGTPSGIVRGAPDVDDLAEPSDAELVAVREGSPRASGRRDRLRAWLRRRWRRPFGALPFLISRRLRLVALVMLGLLGAATVVMAQALHTSVANAVYVTVLDVLGGANASPDAGPVQKITEMVLAIVSIALIPVITAAVVEAVVNAKLALALGRLREPVSGHVIVVGLGNVGTRVIRQLHDLGIPVVAIDQSDNSRGAQVARENGIPVILGDASREEILRAASVQTCRALVALSSDDVTNLQAGLHARAIQENLRVVLRLFDGDFADRIQRVFGISASRSVSYLAAPAFAAAMLEREVIGTIPVKRQVLLIAEVTVASGSELDGSMLSAVNETGQVRVIALTVDRGRTTLWSPPDRPLDADDRLIVVATKAGVSGLLGRTAAPARAAEVEGEAR